MQKIIESYDETSICLILVVKSQTPIGNSIENGIGDCTSIIRQIDVSLNYSIAICIIASFHNLSS